jgi:hypothetical protein
MVWLEPQLSPEQSALAVDDEDDPQLSPEQSIDMDIDDDELSEEPQSLPLQPELSEPPPQLEPLQSEPPELTARSRTWAAGAARTAVARAARGRRERMKTMVD